MIPPFRTTFLLPGLLFWALDLPMPVRADTPGVLGTDAFQSYVDQFRADDRWYFDVATDDEVSTKNNGTYGGQFVKNAQAFDYLKDRIPLLDVPDVELEKTYYYRWWTFRKHLKNIGTAASPRMIVTEYIDPVDWADTSNAIAAPAGHHIYEGRWLDDPTAIRDYIRYWMTNNAANPRRYSTWLADAVLAFEKVRRDDVLIDEMVASTTNRLNLARNYDGWVNTYGIPGGERQQAYLTPEDGMFWQNDDRDAMEFSFGGNGKRPSINSDLYGDARAIAAMYRIAAGVRPEKAADYAAKAALFDQRADALRTAVQDKLWDPQSEFFKTGYGPNGSRPPNFSMDYGIRRHTWWSADHLGTQEWIQYDFPAAVTVNRTEAYFFEDSGAGGASRMPQSWLLQYWDGTQWLPCQLQDGAVYTTTINAFNGVVIQPVTTTKLRLAAKLQPGFSAGTLEWRVFSPANQNVAFTATASASYTDTWGGTVLALNDERPDGYNLQARREIIGLTPWYFHLPVEGGAVDYSRAWSHLQSFESAHGLTTGARDETGYYPGDLGNCCLWDGPIWPFSTAVTLTAMSNLLHDYHQSYISRMDYFSQLATYAHSQRFTLQRGGEQRTLSWIDESLSADGVNAGLWSHIGGQGLTPGAAPRGFAYNHSTFADLVITGLIGLKPRGDDFVEVDPLVPLDSSGNYVWDHFCMDRIAYHGKHLTVIYDQTGDHYQRGAGLSVFVDGALVANSATPGKLTALLPGTVSAWTKSFFPADVAASDLGGDADPDHDGFSNRLEYLAGTDPSSAASRPSPRGYVITGLDGPAMMFEISARDDAAAVVSTPEFSSDLVNWSADGFVGLEPVPVVPADGQPQDPALKSYIYRYQLPTPPPGMGFVRLKVLEK